MTRIFRVLFLCCFVSVFGCINSKVKENDSIPTIYVNPTKAKDAYIYDVCDSIILIPLTDSNMYTGAGAAERLFVSDKYIFISYDNQRKLDLFDWQGQQLNILDKVGRGPGEYLRIHKMSYLESTKELYATSGIDKKILVYGVPDFNFVREEETPSYVRNLWKFDTLSSVGLFYTEGDFVYDFNKLSVGVETPIEITPISKVLMDEGYNYSFTDTVLMYVDQSVAPTLYKLSSNGIEPKYKVKYIEQGFDKEDFFGAAAGQSFIGDFMTRFQLDNASGLMLLPAYSEEGVSFMYASGAVDLYSLRYAVYGSASNDVQLYSSLRFKNIPNNIYPYSVYGDFFVTLIIPENFVPQNTSDLDKAGEYINNELNRVSNTPEAICTPFVMLYRLRRG